MKRAVATDVLETPLDRMLGARTAKALEKLELRTAGDLLADAPRRYVHRGELVPRAVEGESVTVVAHVLARTHRPMNARRGFLLKVTISDGVYDMSLTSGRWPSTNQAPTGNCSYFLWNRFSYRGELQLTHPEYQVLEDAGDVNEEEIARPLPLYPVGVAATWTIEKAIGSILDQVQPDDNPEPLPP